MYYVRKWEEKYNMVSCGMIFKYSIRESGIENEI